VTTAAPETRPVTWAVLALTCARAGDVPQALYWLRRLIDWCHAQDEGSGEEADP
jgi:hypothetical protein